MLLSFASISASSISSGQGAGLPYFINGTTGTYTWAGTANKVALSVDTITHAYVWAGSTSSIVYPGLITASIGRYSWAGLRGSVVPVILLNTGYYTWAGTANTVPRIFNSISGRYTWNGVAFTLAPIPHSARPGGYRWAGRFMQIRYGGEPSPYLIVYAPAQKKTIKVH